MTWKNSKYRETMWNCNEICEVVYKNCKITAKLGQMDENLQNYEKSELNRRTIEKLSTVFKITWNYNKIQKKFVKIAKHFNIYKKIAKFANFSMFLIPSAIIITF